MYTKSWQIIKDDERKTYEVCGQAGNSDSFNNRVYAFQKAGMKVSCQTPPVTNKNSSKAAIKIISYTIEDGLFERLTKEFNELILRAAKEW